MCTASKEMTGGRKLGLLFLAVAMGLLVVAGAGCDDEESHPGSDGPVSGLEAGVDLSVDGPGADAGADQGGDGPTSDGPLAESAIPDSAKAEGMTADGAKTEGAVPDSAKAEGVAPDGTKPDQQVADGQVALDTSLVVKLWFGNMDTTAKTIEVLIDSPFDVSAFGFYLTNITLTGAAGGLAGSSGFTVVVGPTAVSGFSAGAYINATQGVLINLSYGAVLGSVCFQNPIVADPSAKTLPVSVGPCITP